MSAIQGLPFFGLLILLILPTTIGIILLTKALSLITDLYKKRKETDVIIQLGELLLFIVFLTVIIESILYIVGDQPDSFSFFDFLIVEMLPITWYTILFYGILVNIVLLMKGASR